MNLTVAPVDDRIHVTVDETRLDAAVATCFKDRMRAIVTQGKKPVYLDLGQVDFMDSSGLGAVIAVHKAMPPGLQLELGGLTPNVDRVFRLTRMDAVFKIRPADPPHD